MGDDLTTGGILPVEETSADDAEFDPDAIESDDLLDDFVEDSLLSDDLSGVDDEDPLLESIDE